MRSRRRLTFFYSLVMFMFMAVLIFLVHQAMAWSIASEQARELTDTADNLERSQTVLLRPDGAMADNSPMQGSSEKMFYYILDNDGHVLNFSRASRRLEPFVLDIIDQEKVPETETKIYSSSREGRTVKIMLTARGLEKDGRPQGIIYVGKDVTSINRGLVKAMYVLAALAFLALLLAAVLGHIMSGRAFVPILAAYDKQKQFAADASHELRTPLSVIMAAADLLDNDKSITSPILKQTIADVRDEVKKMSRLVSELLFIARADNQALPLQAAAVDMSEVIGAAVRMMQPLAEKKGVILQSEALPSAVLMGDGQKLRQLVLILVDNAVKYTQPGGRIAVSLQVLGRGHIGFAVRDTGIGISPSEQSRIFDRFYRVDKERSREMGGSGLGLAIARTITDMYHGSIAVSSQLGQGTVFKVDLHDLRRGKEA
jgi:K+-sensing histidine kinase KdpD